MLVCTATYSGYVLQDQNNIFCVSLILLAFPWLSFTVGLHVCIYIQCFSTAYGVVVSAVVTFILTLILYTPLLLYLWCTVFTVVVEQTITSELLLHKLLKIPMMLLFCKRPLPLTCFYGDLHVTGVLLRKWTHTTCRLFMKKWAKQGIYVVKVHISMHTGYGTIILSISH